jgi:hypothetical protein
MTAPEAAALAAAALPGVPFPLGATAGDGGTNFAVASGVADRVDLCLFDEARAITGGVAFGPEVLGHAAGDPSAPSTLDSAEPTPDSVTRRPSAICSTSG